MIDRKSILRQNIEHWIKRNNVTQAELSRRLGISYQYLWRMLKGDRSIGPKNEARLVEAFGLKSVSELYKNPEENNPMLDRLIDKEARLQDHDHSTYKLEIVEKLVDLLNEASPEVADHINRQIDLLAKIK